MGDAVTTIGTPPAKPMKAPHVLDELLADGSMVLYHTAQRRMMTLNPTAALIWECCDGEHGVAEIAAEVRALFPTSDAIDADVRALLERLEGECMLAGSGGDG